MKIPAVQTEAAGNGWLVALVLFFTFAFFYSHGCSDVDRFWMAWMDTLAAYPSFTEGFAAVTRTGDYPAGSLFILYLIKSLSIAQGWDVFVLLKAVLLVFLLASSAVFYYLTRNLFATLLMHFFWLLSSVMLGYLDILYTPFLLLSLWALSMRRWTQAAAWFCVCCAIKYQPLIIAPFVAVYLWKQLAKEGLPARSAAWAVCWPVLVYLLGMLWWVGMDLWQSFYNGLLHSRLSFQGLNAYWAYMQIKVLSGEPIQQVRGATFAILYGSRLLFAGLYLLLLWRFFQQRRISTHIDFLLFAMTGFYTYFIVISGVHENHLFVATVLASCLYVSSDRHRAIALFVLLMNAINLVLFGGLSGSGLGFAPVFVIDMSIPLALINTFFYFYLYHSLWTGRLSHCSDTVR